MTINDQEATSNLTSTKCLPLVSEPLCLDLELEELLYLNITGPSKAAPRLG